MMRREAIYFGMGAVAGSAVTALFFLFKEGFIFVGEGTPISHKEEASSTDGYEDSEKPVSLKDTSSDLATNRIAYHDILHEQGYQTEEIKTGSEIHAISESEYFEVGRLGSFEMKALTLYSDDVVADAVTDELLMSGDLATALGSDNNVPTLRRMFNNGADMLYFRNERLHTLYEINADNRTYTEVTG